MGSSDPGDGGLDNSTGNAADHPSLQPDEVEDGLLLSSAWTETMLEVLQRHRITHILQVGYELQPHHPGAFVYGSCPLADRFDADIAGHLPAAFSFIADGLGSRGGRVLVHCMHGQSRSAAVVVAYLMWRDRRPFAECLAAVRACRPRVELNDGFQMQLCLLAELGFDLSRWPGWSVHTYSAIRQLQQQQQQQLLQPPPQQQQCECGAGEEQPIRVALEQRGLDSSINTSADAAVDMTHSPEHAQDPEQKQRRRQQDQQQQPQQQQPQQQQPQQQQQQQQEPHRRQPQGPVHGTPAAATASRCALCCAIM